MKLHPLRVLCPNKYRDAWYFPEPYWIDANIMVEMSQTDRLIICGLLLSGDSIDVAPLFPMWGLSGAFEHRKVSF